MKTLIIDWNKKRSLGMKKYIEQRIVDGKEEIHFTNPKRGYIENVRFFNFPQLHFADNQVIQCGFENCGEIYLTKGCGHGRCRFKNIKGLHCKGKFLMYCEFEDIQCAGKALVEMEHCRMSGCTFKNIKLSGESLLVLGHGSSYVSGCKLENITTERKDSALFYRDESHYFPFVDERTSEI